MYLMCKPRLHIPNLSTSKSRFLHDPSKHTDFTRSLTTCLQTEDSFHMLFVYQTHLWGREGSPHRVMYWKGSLQQDVLRIQIILKDFDICLFVTHNFKTFALRGECATKPCYGVKLTNKSSWFKSRFWSQRQGALKTINQQGDISQP